MRKHDRATAKPAIRLLAACAVLLAAATPTHAQTPTAEPGLPMWVVRDADSTIYITGTVHILRDDAQWRSPKLDAALASASELRLELAEIADDHGLQKGILALLPDYGAYDGKPVTSFLSDAEKATLVEKLAQVDAPPNALELIDTHQPWLAVLLLGRDDFSGGTHKFVNGIDNALARWAVANRMPVKGMEKLEVQIAMSADSSFDDQLQYLRNKLHPSPVQQLVNRRAIDAAYGAWLRGETGMTEAIVALMYAGSAKAGSTDALLKNRNEAWAAEIEEMLKGAGTTFIAVGAAHLVGKDSLQTRLKLRGIETERY